MNPLRNGTHQFSSVTGFCVGVALTVLCLCLGTSCVVCGVKGPYEIERYQVIENRTDEPVELTVASLSIPSDPVERLYPAGEGRLEPAARPSLRLVLNPGAKQTVYFGKTSHEGTQGKGTWLMRVRVDLQEPLARAYLCRLFDVRVHERSRVIDHDEPGFVVQIDPCEGSHHDGSLPDPRLVQSGLFKTVRYRKEPESPVIYSDVLTYFSVERLSCDDIDWFHFQRKDHAEDTFGLRLTLKNLDPTQLPEETSRYAVRAFVPGSTQGSAEAPGKTGEVFAAADVAYVYGHELRIYAQLSNPATWALADHPVPSQVEVDYGGVLRFRFTDDGDRQTASVEPFVGVIEAESCGSADELESSGSGTVE